MGKTRTWLTTLMIAAAGTAIAAGPAQAEAPVQAEPVFEAFTVLNGGKNLAVTDTGRPITAPGQTNDQRQMWERRIATHLAPKPGFSPRYQIRNLFTGLCLADAGEGQQLAMESCIETPGATSPQLWRHHLTPDLVVGGVPHFFVQNRATLRVLSQSPEFGTNPPVVSSPEVANNLSAAAAHQLWRFHPSSS